MKRNKSKKITFYLNDAKVLDFAVPPGPIAKALPYWYKRQTPTSDEFDKIASGVVATTIKKCLPIFDTMTAGYVFYSPCDIYIDATDPEKIIYSVPASVKKVLSHLFSHHAREQYSDYPINTDLYHKDLLRIHSLWTVGTEKGYSTLFMDPMHKDPSPIQVFGGIIDTDNFISNGHFSFLVKKGFQGIIKQGTPLVQIFPFKRDNWEMNMETVENSRRIHEQQALSLRSTFYNAYKSKFRANKEYR